MKLKKFPCMLTDSKNRRSCLCTLLPAASLLCLVFFFGSASFARDQREKLSRLGIPVLMEEDQSNKCQNQSRPYGSEPLPKGIISKTSNFEMRPLWGAPRSEGNPNRSMSLFAIPVGIKQKENVDKIIKKFPSSDFVLMLFHYDGILDEWKDLEWYHRAIHVSAISQTKWWFAKRFLHPDIVDEYKYIFLWDEDLGVENFDALRYLKIVEEEGLEISQPALDQKSEVHHQITYRKSGKVHRRIYKGGSGIKCDSQSTDPPCTGWVEMMAPVFSKASWRCSWYMIQNDFVHAWGLDKKLGYCAQGDRSVKVGIVDSEYIFHQGLPTLGEREVPPTSRAKDPRMKVRLQSYRELVRFNERWKQAVEEDESWVDPYRKTENENSS